MDTVEERSDFEDAARERQVSEITEAEKVEFLQLIRQGLDRQEAANALDYKGRHFRAICSPQSPYYDEDFARAYGEAIGSLEHEQHRLERLRAEGFRRAMTDSDRLLEKYLMVYDPDWAVLRQKDVNVNVHAIIQQRLKVLPTDLLEQVLAALDKAELEQVEQVEDAEFRALPVGDGRAVA
jgi:hypothetical protein